ncbi:MAG: ATP-binding protein [Hyphomicrobiales bacterium]
MRRLLPRSLPGWLLLMMIALTLAGWAATLAITGAEVSRAVRDVDIYRLGERTVAISRTVATMPPQAREARLAEMNDATLSAWTSDKPAVDSVIPGADELAELEDILRPKLAEFGVRDLRIAEQETRPGEAPLPDRPGPDAGAVERGLHKTAKDFLATRRHLVSMQLPDGAWLNFTMAMSPPPALLTPSTAGPFLAIALILVGLTLWAIAQLTAPYRMLRKAAAKLGEDLYAPPIPESGTQEARAATAALNRMQQRLQQQVSEREYLAAALAHDLRTPITRMTLRCENIANRSMRRTMLDDLGLMERIIASVVDFVSLRHVEEEAEKVDLVSLVQSVTDRHPRSKVSQHLQSLPRIVARVRPVSLTRAISNLVENAIRYGKHATVSIELQPRTVAIVVEDEGPGMTEEDLVRAFEPFRTGDPARNSAIAGTGLGLSIAQGIARLHGGDVRLANRPQGGLRAVVEIPRNLVLVEDKPNVKAADQPA